MSTTRSRSLAILLAAAALTAVAAPAYAATAPATATATAPATAPAPTTGPAPTLQVLPVPVRLSRPGVVLRWSCTAQLGVSVLAQQALPSRTGLSGKGYLPLVCDGAVHWARVALAPVDPATPFLTPGPVTLTAVTSTGLTSVATTTVRPAWSWGR